MRPQAGVTVGAGRRSSPAGRSCAAPRALLLLLAALLALLPLVGQSPAPAQMVGPPPAPAEPTLEVSPESGAAGTSATATATGFDNCPPVGDGDVGIGAVRLLWDDERELTVASVGPSPLPISFQVPDEAAPGTHRVSAECIGDDGLVAGASFLVTVDPELVDVPDVVGSSLQEARRQLEDAGLRLGDTSPSDGGAVVGQDPEEGSLVSPGTAVDLELEPPIDLLVIVPDVVGRTVDGAREILTDAGLELGEMTGDGDRVEEQEPRAGAEVPVGAAVAVSLEAAEVNGEREGNGRDWPVELLLAALLAALVVRRIVKGGQDRRWVRRHVRLVPGPRPTGRVAVAERPDAEGPTVTVRLEPRGDPGTYDLEEVR